MYIRNRHYFINVSPEKNVTEKFDLFKTVIDISADFPLSTFVKNEEIIVSQTYLLTCKNFFQNAKCNNENSVAGIRLCCYENGQIHQLLVVIS